MAWSKSWYEKRKAAGMCVQCGHKSETITCNQCIKRQYEWQKQQRAELRAQGLCIDCRQPSPTVRCRNCTPKRYWDKKKYKELKDKVYQHYGGYRCVCCGETREYFLSIDHVTPCGKKREGVGDSLYRYLVKNDFPIGFQVMCMNCNHAKLRLGKCPCQDKQDDAIS